MSSIVAAYCGQLDSCLQTKKSLTTVDQFLDLEQIDFESFNDVKELNNIFHIINALGNDFHSSDKCMSIYKKCVSIFQSNQSKSGSLLEQEVSRMLKLYKIPFESQVVVNNRGFVTDSAKGMCTVDFVLGDIKTGKHISDYIVMSVKSTCRERWTQDIWTLQFPPKVYYLITTTDDYPSSKRFQESALRQIVTSKPKKKDDRLFKTSFKNLLISLQGNL
jgi:hypothetical protein